VPASRRQQAEVAARRARVLQLRESGLTFQQIADAEGLATRQAAIMDVTRALRARREELGGLTDLHATLELGRLDTLERQVQQVARTAAGHDPDLVLRAVDRLVRISARRSALLGIDADSVAAAQPPAERPASVRDELRAQRAKRRRAAHGTG
jgi:hypothetical protein